jgi:hypothetical protein
MSLSPEVKQIVDALTASARGQMASSAGLERLDGRLKAVEDELTDVKNEVRDLVEELKIANVIERTGQEIEQKKIEHASKLVNRVGDALGRALNSKLAIAVYMLIAYVCLSWIGISPASIRAFLVTYLGGSPAGGS